MVSIKITVVAITLSLTGLTSAAPPENVPQFVAEASPRSTISFHPPGRPCWTSADCFHAYFCAGATADWQGMCTYG